MNEIVFLPAHQLASMIRNRAVSSVEVLDIHLAHIALHDPKLNAIVTLNETQARQQAASADEALAKGESWGALHGVPFTCKDLFATAGVRTTCGYEPLADYIPQNDATVVARIKAAGAILLGKTNLPKLSQGFQTDSALLGRANNPWNLDYTPGGSTGGGAAAVAAGLSPLELGTDGGGSIRIPPHFCGIFGLKPTEYRVSLAGVLWEILGRLGWRHQATPGILARSISDLQLGLSLIEGADDRDWQVPPAPQEIVSPRSLSQCRIAWTDQFGTIPVTAETRSLLQQLVTKLQEAGCYLEYCHPPNFNFELAVETFGEIAGTESIVAASAIEQLGYQIMSPLIPFTNPGALLRGFVKNTGLSFKKYARSLERRDRFIAQMQSFLTQWDAWICPVTPGAAFTHRDVGNGFSASLPIDDRNLPYWTWGTTYTAVTSLTTNPVVTIPIGKTADGLPLGVQVVGQRWRDMQLLAIAERITEISGSFEPPPGF
jgi:amidase